MIVDTSAIVAIVLKKPGFEVLIAKIQASTTAGMGTPSLAEAAIVLSSRLKLDSRTLLGRLMRNWSWCLSHSVSPTGVRPFAPMTATARDGTPRPSTLATA